MQQGQTRVHEALPFFTNTHYAHKIMTLLLQEDESGWSWLDEILNLVHGTYLWFLLMVLAYELAAF